MTNLKQQPCGNFHEEAPQLRVYIQCWPFNGYLCTQCDDAWVNWGWLKTAVFDLLISWWWDGTAWVVESACRCDPPKDSKPLSE